MSTLGNADLNPEKCKGSDAGIEWSLAEDKVIMDLACFYNDFEDLTVFAGFLPQGFQNRDEAETHPKLSIGGTYTFLDAETDDPANGDELSRRAKHRYSAYADYHPSERISVCLNAESSNDRFDTGRINLDDYINVSLSVECQVNDYVKPYIRVQNLFDDDYLEINGFDTLRSRDLSA